MYTHAWTRKHTPNMRSQSSGCRSLFRVTTLPTNKKLRYTNLCNKVGGSEKGKRALPSFRGRLIDCPRLSLSRGNNLARQCIVTVHRASGAHKSPVHHPFCFLFCQLARTLCFPSPAAHICALVSVYKATCTARERHNIYTKKCSAA